MNMSEYFRYFFKNWNWIHSISFIIPFLLPFFFGFPKPLFYIDLISIIFDKVNYLNGLIISFFLMFVISIYKFSGTTTESYTGKTFRSEKGEVFHEVETNYIPPSKENDWSYMTNIDKTIFKVHFILFVFFIVIKYLLWLKIDRYF